MASNRIFQKIEDKYGGRIASLLGVDQANVTFQATNLEPGMAANANADTGVIQVDRGFLKRTNQGRADVRGALIHELAHAPAPGAWLVKTRHGQRHRRHRGKTAERTVVRRQRAVCP